MKDAILEYIRLEIERLQVSEKRYAEMQEHEDLICVRAQISILKKMVLDIRYM